MAEFNDRELKIIHMMTTLQNPLIKDAPHEMKKTIVSMTLKIRGLNFNEEELIDMMQAIIKEQGFVVQKGLGVLDKMGLSSKMLQDLKF